MRQLVLAAAYVGGLSWTCSSIRAEPPGPDAAPPTIGRPQTVPYRTIVLTEHQSSAHGFALSGNGARAACCYRRGFIKVWEAATGREVATLTPEDDNRSGRPPVWLAMDWSGNRLVSAGVAESFFIQANALKAQHIIRGTQVRLWDVAERKSVQVFTAPGQRPRFLAVSLDGSRVSCCDIGLNVRTWESRTGRETRCVDAPPLCRISPVDWPSHWGYSGDGTRFVTTAVCAHDRTRTVACDLAEGRCRILGPEDEQASYGPVAITQDGRRIAIFHFNPNGRNELRVLDFETGQIRRAHSLEVNPPVECWRFNPHGDLLAMAGGDGRAWIIDIASGHRLADIPPSGKRVRAVTFLDRGRLRVLSGGEDPEPGTVSGREVKPLCLQDYRIGDL